MITQQPIEDLPATSPLTIKRFKSLETHTLFDLLNIIPNRYENYSLISPIAKVQEGEIVTIQGIIKDFKNTYTRKRMTIQKAKLEDASGTMDLTWYNQPYLSRVFKTGTYASVAGTAKRFHTAVSFDPKEYDILKNPQFPTIHTGRIVPIYPEKRGLSSRTIREKIHTVLHLFLDDSNNDDIEILPPGIRSTYSLIDATQAYRRIHFPSSMTEASQARKRLAFDELFVIQLSAAMIRKEWKKETVRLPFRIEDTIQTKIAQFIADLPFTLTDAQQHVVTEIISDLQKNNPMNRFLQGDVGSGKTVVAAIAAYAAFLNKYQTVVMAPTEILAKQHMNTLSMLFKQYPVTIGLQTASVKLQKDTHYDIVVGTHALLTKSVRFDTIGLVIIDEQHRFGVAQRATLKQKGINPHLLTMTATPIPRTIALTLYGELDLSVIDQMPQGRVPIKSFLVPPEKRDNAYEWIKKEIKQHGCQIFIICPLIEESETETMKSVKAATLEYQHLQKDIFTTLSVGLLHGKMKPKEKHQVMEDFNNKKYDILVSTSVVEVGIDVPNATIMIIEGAERFGLAQLHQLRGRVGRGKQQSYCFLFANTEEPSVTARLRHFVNTVSGIQLAEYDLKRRGPGEVFGIRQHGYTDLKVANLGDTDLIKQTKLAVDHFNGHFVLHEYPALIQRLEQYRIHQIARD